MKRCQSRQDRRPSLLIKTLPSRMGSPGRSRRPPHERSVPARGRGRGKPSPSNPRASRSLVSCGVCRTIPLFLAGSRHARVRPHARANHLIRSEIFFNRMAGYFFSSNQPVSQLCLMLDRTSTQHESKEVGSFRPDCPCMLAGCNLQSIAGPGMTRTCGLSSPGMRAKNLLTPNPEVPTRYERLQYNLVSAKQPSAGAVQVELPRKHLCLFNGTNRACWGSCSSCRHFPLRLWDAVAASLVR